MEGVELEVRDGGAAARSRSKALARKTGARGLRSILEQSLLDTMYDLPSLDNVVKVVVDEAHDRQRRQAAADLSPTSPRWRVRRTPDDCPRLAQASARAA